jgi:hypothetical protein
MGPTKGSAMSEAQGGHDKSEVARPRRGSVPDLKTADKASAEKKIPTGPRANPLYKTRLCMNFQSTGSCPYTEKCQFAHGVKELEKWESWRTSHKPDDAKEGEDSLSQEGSRSRSQSLEKTMTRTVSSDSHDFGSPQSSSWEFSTPLKSSSSVADHESTPVSTMSKFSLWSCVLDDVENERPHLLVHRPSSQESGGDRPRAATYDNMSQLRDAPTLFPCPPVLATLTRLNLSH